MKRSPPTTSPTGDYVYSIHTRLCPLQVLNGNGYVIRNLKINEKIVSDEFPAAYEIGLFGNTGQNMAGAQVIQP